MNIFFKLVLGFLFVVAAGLSVGVGISIAPHINDFLYNKTVSSMDVGASMVKASDSDVNEPKYWVAPMDPNYRRDGPGKSPMGMDLVPVYDDGKDLAVGTVKISPEVEHNLGVRTAVVKKTKLEESINTVATVQFDERQLQAVHSRVSGWIKSMVVRANGDEVKLYDRLYDIYSPELIAAQEELLIAINANEIGMRAASIAKLRNLGVSKGSIDYIFKQRKVINNISVYAPAAGIVSEMGVAQGAYVTPNTRIMSISGMDPIWVEGEIFENNLAKIQVGATVRVTAEAVPGRQWSGTVDYIYPQLESNSRTAKIRVVIENPDKALLANMYVRINIDTSSTTPMLTVAQEAIIRTGTMERVVLVTGEGQFKSVEVKTGRRTARQVEIIEGLNEADEIVVSAQFLIDSESSINSDFMRMTPLSEAPEIAWATGTVDEIFDDENVMVINHLPVPDWQWPAMEMEFSYAEDTDISGLKNGSDIRFSMRKLESGEILIESIENNSDGSL